MKLQNSWLHGGDSSRGASAFGIRNNTFIGWISASGGSPLAISIAVMPRDQISARES